MKLLLMNTCGVEGVVALADTSLDAPVVGRESLPGRGSSEALMPAMRRLFEAAGWRAADLHAVLAVAGPGSFTGVRVGLSAAKGLCEAAGIGLIAVSRLALVGGGSGQSVALLDAGRGEFYCGVYEGDACLEERLVGRDRVVELAEAGFAMRTCEPQVRSALAGLEVVLVDEPGAEAVLRFGVERIEAGIWSDVALLDANYLRRTDAELAFERKNSERRNAGAI